MANGNHTPSSVAWQRQIALNASSMERWSMGLFNPFTYGRKYAVAWNALIGWYTLKRLSAPEQQLIIAAAEEIVQEHLGRELGAVYAANGPIVALNFIVYAMGEQGVPAGVGDGKWFHVKNPFVAAIGADEVVTQIKPRLEKEHSIELETNWN